MRSFRRRGIFLTQIVSLLPFIAALTAIAGGITLRVMRFEDRVNRQSVEDAAWSDLARRIRLDARTATDAKLETTENAIALVFPKAVYKFTPKQVVRLESGGLPTATWTFAQSAPRVQIESIGGKARLVWLIIQFPLAVEQGAPVKRTFSMAATIGEGGGS